MDGAYIPFHGSCCESTAIFTYTAAPGERNDFTLSHSPSPQFVLPDSVGFGDLGALITRFPLPVVDTESLFERIGIACVPLLVHVTCLTNATVVRADVRLGDGHDRATGAPVHVPNLDCGAVPCFRTVWDGGGGEDNITGTVAFDEMYGGDGKDVLNPGNGPDYVNAGNDDDLVRLNVDGVADQVFCGAGTDTVQRGAVDPLDTVDADCELVGP